MPQPHASDGARGDYRCDPGAVARAPVLDVERGANLARVRIAARGRLLQTTPDDHLQTGRNLVRNGPRWIPQNRRKQFGRRGRLERPAARQHFVHQHAQRPDVGSTISGLAAHLLRRHRVRRLPTCAPTGTSEAIVVAIATAASRRCASPKSTTFSRPSLVTIALAALKSRWMTPRSCAYASASAAWSA